MSDLTSMHEQAESCSTSPVPTAIRPEHKKKYAVVYLRQSTPDQVRNHTGSTESQRALAKLPLEWGWPVELIRVIEDDLGLSGTSSDRRAGLRRVEEMLDQDQVGLVIVRDASRLSRDPYDGERFLKKAVRAGVLLEENGELITWREAGRPRCSGYAFIISSPGGITTNASTPFRLRRRRRLDRDAPSPDRRSDMSARARVSGKRARTPPCAT